MFHSAEEALKYIRENQIAMVDLKITSVSGRWLHVTVPASRFTREHFEEGVGYDGSSGAGFARIESGDVSALPRPDAAFMDPFWELPTISFLCDTVSTETHEPFAGDPRSIAACAQKYLRAIGVADEAWMAPEFEFHVFDRVDVDCDPRASFVRIESTDAESGSGADSGSARGSYFRTPPGETLHDLRSDISLTLESMGIAVRYHHHEVGASGQCEIEVIPAPLLRAADQAMIIKYVVKNMAKRRGKVATFMPKPLFGEAGNGMHVHQRLTREGRPVFYDTARRNYACLSDLALQYTVGLLAHGPALTGLTNPSTNSFKRLVDGFEAPVHLFYSLANRSAAIRVPGYASAPDEKRIEYRPPDFTCNIYLAFAAMLLAGLDGIQTAPVANRDRFGPFDVDISSQDKEFRSRIAALPCSLDEALSALQKDHAFLLKGGVFTEDFIHAWIASRRAEDVAPVALRPHPLEYALYLDV